MFVSEFDIPLGFVLKWPTMTLPLTTAVLRQRAALFVAAEPARLGTAGWWQPPLLVTAVVDERFAVLPEIAADNHLHPGDLLTGARSVIVFFIPFVKDLVLENKAGDRPCRNWGVAYVQTNDLIGRLSQDLADCLAAAGYRSGLTPATHNFDEQRLMARWSHKHLGHLAGLGRFGTHNLLITPKGCAGRLGSLVTDAPLGDHPLIHGDQACLLKTGKACGKCLPVCPVSALHPDRFDRRACWDRLKDNRGGLPEFDDLPQSTHVCGKCLAFMPCSFVNPVKD